MSVLTGGPDVGDVAPDFTLRDQNNRPVTLSDFRGDQHAVLVFYPLTFTRVCQGELDSLRDEQAGFVRAGAQVLAVSVDSVFAHKVWAEQRGFGFPLLADFWPHGAVARQYGVFDEGTGVATRGTFILDKAGIIRHKVVHAIPDARDHDAYLAVLESL